MSLSFTREDLVKARVKNTERLQNRRKKEIQKVKNHFISFVENQYKYLNQNTIYNPEQYKFTRNNLNSLGLIILSEKDIRAILIDVIQQTREELKIKIAWSFSGVSDDVISASIDFFSDIEEEE